LPLKIFKQPAEKAEDEFRQAYDKGVNLGPQNWPDAVQHFVEAAKNFELVGIAQRAEEARALAALFQALISKSEVGAWRYCSQLLKQMPDMQINVGFPASTAALSVQAEVYADDLATKAQLHGESRDINRVASIRKLAQKYLELIGNDLALWRLLKQEVDPQRRAYYLLGLASLIEANSVANTDPKKGVSLLSEAVANLELAGVDPMSLTPATRSKLDNISKIALCWFCGREMQGKNFHYVMLPAVISDHTRQKYGAGTPVSIEGDCVAACTACWSTVRNVADTVAMDYYRRVIDEIRAMEARLNNKIATLENEVHVLRSRLISIRT
jgi:hypothetical protein